MPIHICLRFLLAAVAGCSPAMEPPPADDLAPSGGPDASGAGVPDAGGLDAAQPRVLVKAGPTDNAELIEKLPIARSQSRATRRIAMRLGPEDIPDLAAGDRLSAPAEVQVTTRCDIGQSAPGCGYNPKVAAQIILTGDAGDKLPGGPESIALSSVEELTCTSAEHHCKIIFPTGSATRVLEEGDVPPCVASGSCHINLVMWAWDSQARAGEVDDVLVGENEGDYLVNGIVKGDKGRLMAVRERGIAAGDRTERETSGSGSLSIPTTTAPVVIYSHRLAAGGERLMKDEQYVVEAKVVTAVSSRARFSTKLYLTKDPAGTGGKLEKVVPEEISESNGINCTDGTSPCTSRKVSVFRIDGDIDGPVYLNVVAVSAVPGGGSASVTVRREEGFVRSTRYAAEYKD